MFIIAELIVKVLYFIKRKQISLMSLGHHDISVCTQLPTTTIDLTHVFEKGEYTNYRMNFTIFRPSTFYYFEKRSLNFSNEWICISALMVVTISPFVQSDGNLRLGNKLQIAKCYKIKYTLHIKYLASTEGWTGCGSAMLKW